MIEKEQSDYLPEEEITGLAMMFGAALAKLRQGVHCHE
jgi:hypothetical protein